MWYFYILISDKDNKLYYGSTNNLKRRFNEHNKGYVDSTKARIPLSLIYYEAYSIEKLARQREHSVKSSQGSRHALLKRICLLE